MQANVAIAFKSTGPKFQAFRPITMVLEIPRGIDPIVALEGLKEQKEYETGREFYFAYSLVNPMEVFLKNFRYFYIREELKRVWKFNHSSARI